MPRIMVSIELSAHEANLLEIAASVNGTRDVAAWVADAVRDRLAAELERSLAVIAAAERDPTSDERAVMREIEDFAAEAIPPEPEKP